MKNNSSAEASKDATLPSVVAGSLASFPNLIAAAAGFLAFEGELMAGKILLPQFGGSAYVWCSTILFFQIVLLIGYFASRWLGDAPKRVRGWILTGLGLSGFLILVRSLPQARWLPQELQPFIALAPFAGLSMALFCTTPLLHRRQINRTDYRIYAWSNTGAFAGLLFYPLLIEPRTDLTTQSWLWALGGFLVCVFGLRGAWALRVEKTASSPQPSPLQGEGERGLGRFWGALREIWFPGNGVSSVQAEGSVPERNGIRWQWWVLPAISSATLLATTNQISYEASAGPLTWALPLAVFLATYVWAFSANRRTTIGFMAIVGLIALTVVLLAGPRTPQKLGLLLLGGGTAMAACHTWLALSRNANSHLFYRVTALSGAVGSALTIIIPRLTTSPIEFPVLTLGMLAVAGFVWSSRVLKPVVTTFAVVAAGLTFFVTTSKNSSEIASCRNLYGCMQVFKQPEKELYTLVNNNTIHGEQDRQHPEKGLTYYVKDSGVAEAILEKQKANPALKIGVIGLGVGTINHWARSEDSVLYYEINPQVETLARQFFSYLDSKTRVVIGDGRKCMEAESPQEFDVLILDAFTGDAVPTHLLTVEAGRVYRRHLKEEGVIVVNITNAHVDLWRVAEGLAQTMGMSAESVVTDKTRWVVLKPGGAVVDENAIRWTDQRSSILQIVK